jgi:tRNA(Ile)-lysidine synthase
MGGAAGGVALAEGVRAVIRRHALLAGGESVLVAVSGGADSVALLHVLRELVPALGLRLSVGHVDHALRPDSAADAEFVAELARSLSLPVLVERVAVELRGSLEASAREARYRALRGMAVRLGADRIALGHTADDQAETVLMRILQGAGPRGLAGIPPVRDCFVRPLIETARADVLAELRRAGLSWREDPTNRDVRFLRNRLRHDVLPLLTAVNPGVVDALGRTARLAREHVDSLTAWARRELERACDAPGDRVLSRARLQSLPADVAAEVLRLAAAELGQDGPLRAWAHRGLRRILRDPPPRRSFRLGAIVLEVSGDRVRLGCSARASVARRPLVWPGRTPLPEIAQAIDARCFARPREYVAPRDRRRAAFDADLVGEALAVRARRPGDRLVPFGSTASRRLKSVLIDAKVPRWARDAVAVVEHAGEILWVAGVRRGAGAPVTAATRRVLELSVVFLAEASPPG